VRPLRSRRAVLAALAAGIGVAVVLAAPGGSAPSVGVALFSGRDSSLCPFPFEVTVHSALQRSPAFGLWLIGPGSVTLRNTTSGRSVTLQAPGSFGVTRSGTVTFSGSRLWLSAVGAHVPFLATVGSGSIDAPLDLLAPGGSRARVVDPCALLAPSHLSTAPRATPAPWGLPADQLGQIAYAGLTPVVGSLIRHDHVHLDLIVNGRKVTVPAGVGLAEPVDRGVCPPGPRLGDCATGHFYTALVAVSPIHTHSTSGLIHIESDRPGTFTLGQFFDEWGVRLNSSCLGSYCTGAGRQLRAYVDGKRFHGNPRTLVLTNRQEIALVYGGAGAFEAVPSNYTGGWPGLGCGGHGETSCLPPGG
jgi:hypothetical protein